MLAFDPLAFLELAGGPGVTISVAAQPGVVTPTELRGVSEPTSRSGVVKPTALLGASEPTQLAGVTKPTQSTGSA